MITYKQSDIKFSWEKENVGQEEPRARICGYVKEGAELEGMDENESDDVNKWTVDQNRHKRQIDQYEYNRTKTRCPLLLVADYRFFQEMGASNTKTTINYLVSTFAVIYHISKLLLFHTTEYIEIYVTNQMCILRNTCMKRANR